MASFVLLIAANIQQIAPGAMSLLHFLVSASERRGSNVMGSDDHKTWERMSNNAANIPASFDPLIRIVVRSSPEPRKNCKGPASNVRLQYAG